MRRAAATLLLIGCFDPKVETGQPCTDWCPPPETCMQGRCGGGGSSDDATTPVNGNYVFVTSEKKAVVELGSFAAADAWCQRLADAANLPGTYVAWTTNAYYRMFARNPRGWYRVDGKPFADTLEDFADSKKIFYPARLTEYGADLVNIGEVSVGTGTYNGREDVIGYDCASFTLSTGELLTGDLDGGTTLWTSDGPSVPCSQQVRLYCFGIDKHVTVTVPPATNNRVAFLTTMGQLVGSQVADLDARCSNEAGAAGLSGTYKAWVSTTTAAANARFTSGAAWKRPDDVIAVSGDLSELYAPLSVDIAMSHHNGLAWTGAFQPDLKATNGATQTCNDWTTNTSTATAYVGMAGRGRFPDAFGVNMTPPVCTNRFYLYCLQE